MPVLIKSAVFFTSVIIFLLSLKTTAAFHLYPACTDETKGSALFGNAFYDPDNCPSNTFCYDIVDMNIYSCHLQKSSSSYSSTQFIPVCNAWNQGAPLRTTTNPSADCNAGECRVGIDDTTWGCYKIIDSAPDNPPFAINAELASITSSSVGLYWDRVDEAKYYQVWYTKNNFSWSQLNPDPFDTFATLSGLEANTQYTIHLNACNFYGCSPPSGSISIQTLASSTTSTGGSIPMCTIGTTGNYVQSAGYDPQSCPIGTCFQYDLPYYNCYTITSGDRTSLVTPACTPGVDCTEAAGKLCPNGVDTAIGCIPTQPRELVFAILKLAAGVGGGIAFLLMLLGAFQMITSAGNPETLKMGQERFTSAVIGLLFVIFSVLLMQIIGFDILKIPGFGR